VSRRARRSPAPNETPQSGPETDGPRDETPLVQTAEVTGRGPESTIEYQPVRIPLTRGLTSLRHRDFRLFWTGQLVSLVGTWMQIVAQSWLVLELTGSAFALGVLSALQFVPTLAFSLLGGVVADRLPRRSLLLLTQTSAALLALALAVLTATGTVRFGHVMVLAALLGFVNALDMPTRQAFVVELVGPADLRNAIALNSAAFNSARLVGPAVAGLAIGWIGIAGCFYVNALSFLAVIAGLLLIHAGKRPAPRPSEPGSIWEDLREGLGYVARTPLVRMVIVLVAIVGTFAMNMGVLMPLIARDVLRVGAEGFGFLTSAMGVGSLVAAIVLAYQGQAVRPRLLFGAAVALGLLEVALALVRQFSVAVPVLAATGFSMIFLTTLANTTLQVATPDPLRGRVMSLYTTVFVGTTPLGSLFTGALAEAWGVPAPLLVGGIVSVGAGLAGYRLSSRRRSTD